MASIDVGTLTMLLAKFEESARVQAEQQRIQAEQLRMLSEIVEKLNAVSSIGMTSKQPMKSTE